MPLFHCNHYHKTLFIFKILAVLFFLYDPATAQNENEQKEIRMLDSIGFAYEKIPQYDSAIYFYKKELQVYLKADNKKEAGRTYLKIGRMLSEKGNIEEASEVFFKMLRCAELSNDTIRITIANTRIGRCYEFLNQKEKALEYYYKALTISEKFAVHKQSISLYGTIGNLLLENNKASDCLLMVNKADSLAKLLNDPYFRYGADNLAGLYYAHMKDFPKAEKYLLNTLEYNLQKNPNSSHTAGAYFNLGDVTSKQGKTKEALDYYGKAYKIFEQQQEKKNLRDISFNLATLYEDIGDYKQAVLFHKKYGAYNDSIVNEQNNVAIAELQTAYEVEKKDARIKLLDKEKELKEQQLVEANKRIILYILLCLLLFVAIIFTFLFFKQRQKTLAAISKQNLALMKSQTQMNPHFIFNALVSLQEMIIKEQKQKAVNAVSKLSKLLRATLNNSDKEHISLAEEIKFLEDYVQFENMRSEQQTAFNIMLEGLETEYVLLPPMLIQPLIENVFKHAFDETTAKRNIHLIIKKKDPGLIEVMVTDNGKGMVETRRKDSKALLILTDRIKNMFLYNRVSCPEKDLVSITKGVPDGSGTVVKFVIPYIE